MTHKLNTVAAQKLAEKYHIRYQTRLINPMDRECSPEIEVEQRITYSDFLAALREQMEADCRAVCRLCRKGHKAELKTGEYWHFAGGDSYSCPASPIRRQWESL